MKVAVIGTGYVGLVAGVCLAEYGNKVTCIDTNQQKINVLAKGKSPIFEPGLEEILDRAIYNGNIKFTTEGAEELRNADVSIVAVGTPSDIDGSYNSRYILSAAERIKDALKGVSVKRHVIMRSTIDPLEFNRVNDYFNGNNCQINLISNPEFLAQGSAVEDFRNPGRVVIGTNDAEGRSLMRDMYNFVDAHKIRYVDPMTAIMSKLTANNLLYCRIAMANELARMCDKTGANYSEMAESVGLDPRIGQQFLRAGPGVGGSCFGKDNRGLAAVAQKLQLDLPILSNVDISNKAHKQYVASVIADHYDKYDGMKGKTIGILGLAFKAHTDDMREAASIDIVKHLQAKGARIRAHDPEAMPNARTEFGDSIQYCDSMQEVADGAHGLVILTEWPMYANPDFNKLKQLMNQNVIFDCRNIIGRDRLRKEGFSNYVIGQGTEYVTGFD